MNDSEKTIHISPPKYIEWAGIAALSMLGLFLLVLTIDTLDDIGRSDVPAMNTINVSGQGSVSRAPDVARINFSVQNTASTAAQAQELTTKQANAAIDFVRDQGVDEKDIKTLSYSVSPQYDYSRPCPAGALCPEYYSYGGTPRITGYQVMQTVEVTVRDLDDVSDILAGLGEQNVQNVYGPSFTLDDPTSAQNEAREEAITKAREQAETLAKQLGVRLVRIVSFSEGGGYPLYYAKEAAYGMGGDVGNAPQPDIPAGENEYTSYVNITYEIR